MKHTLLIGSFEKVNNQCGEVMISKEYIYEENDILSVQGMLPYLEKKEIPDKIIIHASLESTNKTAKEMAIQGAEHGTVVIADYQRAGMGRYSRSFFSPSKHGIYMSFLLHLPLWVEIPTIITSYAAVSVCEAIEMTLGKKPQIKWVNDVYLNGKKICGILTEASSSNIQWIVVGIGINFTTPSMGYPEEIKDIAGSIFSESRPTITRNQLIAEIANRILCFEQSYGSKVILAEYKKRLMGVGKKVSVAGSCESFEATIVDIDETGHLIVQKGDNEIISLSAGEISIRI